MLLPVAVFAEAAAEGVLADPWFAGAALAFLVSAPALAFLNARSGRTGVRSLIVVLVVLAGFFLLKSSVYDKTGGGKFSFDVFLWILPIIVMQFDPARTLGKEK
ncbi:MAG: hypothetical protein JWM59_1576 [Verrucomicrobiales bacterium]|nr:hypothetical protein [Verrucomicrobiales bacterium]